MATTEATPKSTVKTCYTRKDFVEEWSFPLQALHDFELNGEPARYAPGYPKEWDDENRRIDFRDTIRSGRPASHVSYYAAISPDKKLLAVTSNYERILVYDIESQELRQTLDGAGHVVFGPLAQSDNGGNATEEERTESSRRPAYALGCSASDVSSRTGLHNQLVFWELDQHGRLLDQEGPIDPSVFAMQALDAILPGLVKNHEWSKDFVEASSLHEDFAKALSIAGTAHRRRHITSFKDAVLGNFGSTSFSSDGRLFLYHTQNNSTQLGMRDPKDLPRVIVVDVLAGKELHRLSGHTDCCSKGVVIGYHPWLRSRRVSYRTGLTIMDVLIRC